MKLEGTNWFEVCRCCSGTGIDALDRTINYCGACGGSGATWCYAPLAPYKMPNLGVGHDKKAAERARQEKNRLRNLRKAQR